MELKMSGPMFEPANLRPWKSLHDKGGAHYNTYSCMDVDGMKALRTIFENGEADNLQFCLFSTSGVHGCYTSIEEVEDHVMNGAVDDDGYGPDSVTFLIVQPRLVCLRYGNCNPLNNRQKLFTVFSL